MSLTAYFRASLLICGQSFRVTGVILVEIQPTGINGRAGKKTKWHAHARINAEWRLTRSFNTQAGEFSGRLRITGRCHVTVCPPSFRVKSWVLFVFGSRARVTRFRGGREKNKCPLLWGLTAFTMMRTHPADLIWLQKPRVL